MALSPAGALLAFSRPAADALGGHLLHSPRMQCDRWDIPVSSLSTLIISLGAGIALAGFGQIGYRFGYKQGNWDGKRSMIRAMQEDDQ